MAVFTCGTVHSYRAITLTACIILLDNAAKYKWAIHRNMQFHCLAKFDLCRKFQLVITASLGAGWNYSWESVSCKAGLSSLIWILAFLFWFKTEWLKHLMYHYPPMPQCWYPAGFWGTSVGHAPRKRNHNSCLRWYTIPLESHWSNCEDSGMNVV